MVKGKNRTKWAQAADLRTAIKELRNLYHLTPKVWNAKPFTTLIGTILSQRTKDENTARASEALFAKYKDAKHLARAEIKDLERLIRPSGFYHVKARVIKKVSQELLDRFDGRVPDELDDLLSLPGVGRKTANCVLVYGFNKKAIPVDTHVHRISNRLGWVRTKTPEETEAVLVRILPKSYWLEINDLLVTHGQRLCRPLGPKCSLCPVNNICPEGISVNGERGQGRSKGRNTRSI